MVQIGGIKYTPGMYTHKRPTGSQLADKHFREMEKKYIEKKSNGAVMADHQNAIRKPRITSGNNCR